MSETTSKRVVILVGSGNRAKILAVKNAFIPLIPHLQYFQQNTQYSSKNNLSVENKNEEDFFLTVTVQISSKINLDYSNNANSTDRAFETIIIEFVGISVESGISDQPYTDEETKLGAFNRARNTIYCVVEGEKKDVFTNDTSIIFAVGLEGGVQKQFRLMKQVDDKVNTKSISKERTELNEFELECYAWMCIIAISEDLLNAPLKEIQDHERYVSYARTASFILPRKIKELMIEQNLELGHADDAIFGRTDSKSKDGVVGLLTKGIIDRSLYYSHALSLALIPFLSHEVPDLY